MRIMIEVLNKKDMYVYVDEVQIGFAEYDSGDDAINAPWRARYGANLLGDYETGGEAAAAIMDRHGFSDYLEVTALCNVPGCDGTAHRPKVFCDQHHRSSGHVSTP